LTSEQSVIIETSEILKNNETIKINAFAGTGKTTTLLAVTNTNIDMLFLYIAFNSSIVKEARRKFGKNVEIFTWHRLAIDNLDMSNYNIRTKEYDLLTIADILEIEDNLDLVVDVMRLMKYYFNSDCGTLYEASRLVNLLNSETLGYAITLWNKFNNGDIDITHDFYLKKFSLNETALSKLSNKYDCFLLDEAQDCNPVTLKIFNSLTGKKKILVGDTYQQIYQFRGSVNAMDTIKAEYNFFLTYTFRCSENVVNEANRILKNYLGSKTFLTSKNTEVPDINTVAYITRTNAMLIELISIFKDEDEDTKFNLLKTPTEIFNTAVNIYHFLNNDYDKLSKEFKYLKKFPSEARLQEFANDYDMVDIKSSIKLVKRYKKYIFVLMESAKKMQDKKSHITLTTAHTSKGLEWDRVLLASDFKNLDEIDTIEKLIEEGNLLYVAVTRAKYEILRLEDEKE